MQFMQNININTTKLKFNLFCLMQFSLRFNLGDWEDYNYIIPFLDAIFWTINSGSCAFYYIVLQWAPSRIPQPECTTICVEEEHHNYIFPIRVFQVKRGILYYFLYMKIFISLHCKCPFYALRAGSPFAACRQIHSFSLMMGTSHLSDICE